jgi:anti-sigma factor RsiW
MKRARLTITDSDLAAYVDDEASLVPRSDVQAHLEETPEDRARVDLWLQHRELLQLAFGRAAHEPVPLALSVSHPRTVRPDHDDDLEAEITAVQALEPLTQSQNVSQSGVQPSHRWLYGFILGVLCAGLVLVFKPELMQDLTALGYRLGVSGSEPQKLDEINLQLARRASEAHRTFVAARNLGLMGALTIADDPSLSLALTKLVGVGVHVPNFKLEGLHLVAARVTPGELGPAAFLLFQSDLGETMGGETHSGETIGLLISRIVGAEVSYPVYRNDRGTGTLTWTTGQGGYVLTGQAEASRLLAMRKVSGF